MNLLRNHRRKHPSLRWERVDREGSQFFRYEVEPIPPTATLALEYDDIHPHMKRYFPVDFVHIINNSAVDILLTISPAQDFTIPSGSIISLSDRPITQIRLKNLDTAIGTLEGEVTLLFQRLPLSEDRVIRREA